MTAHLRVNPSEVAAAANDAGEAAAQARGQDASRCLTQLTAAVPGSDTVAYLPTLGTDWTTYTDYWVSQAEDYSAALHEASTTYAASDSDASGYLETTLASIENVPEPS